MKINNTTRKSESGFTLIELSIVLVIIGLIVGGVLVGQDLIKAAEVRATITQVEKYNTSVRTFQGKFGGLPGDLTHATALEYGLKSITGATGGDGNGIIETTTAGVIGLAGEPLLFWNELSVAGMVDGSYGTGMGFATTTAGDTVAATTSATLNNFIPAAKMGRANSFTVGSTGGTNYYVLGNIGQATLVLNGVYAAATSEGLSPVEANNIDKKIDDGFPATGTIRAMSTVAAALSATTLATPNPVSNAGANTTTCVNTTPDPDTYQLTATTPRCALRIQFN